MQESGMEERKKRCRNGTRHEQYILSVDAYTDMGIRIYIK